jgi:effector-binding domain-containing protein
MPSGKYMVGFIHGYYGQLGDLPQRMEAYAKENNLEFCGPVQIVYVLDELCVKDPAQYLSRVSVAVK